MRALTLRSSMASSILITVLSLHHPGEVLGQTPASADAAAIYRASSPAVFLIELRSHGAIEAIGSAFLVDDHRFITNAHVVRGGQPFLKTGAVSLPLTIERLDPVQDLAVLRANAALDATPLTLAAAEPGIGTAIFALGNPQGLERSISEGIVSGVRLRDGRRLIQITAPISPGSSGGPVLARNGTVVGVTVGYMEGGQNLNFAVPVTAVRALLASKGSTSDFAAQVAVIREALARERGTQTDSASRARAYADAREALEAAALHASTATDFLTLASLAYNSLEPELVESYAAEASRRDRSVSDSTRSLLLRAWMWNLIFADSSDLSTVARMLAVADTQQLRRPRDAEVYAFRSMALRKLGRGDEAIAAGRRAVELGDSSRVGWYWTVYHEAVGELGRPVDDDAMFAAMVRAGQANADDWREHAQHLDARSAYEAAGDAYAMAFRILSKLGRHSPEDVCSSGLMYWSGDKPDQALDAFRACLEAYAVAERVDTGNVALAHRGISAILQARGVYDQAESHARQALALNPNDAWAAYDLSLALESEQRPSEAATAAETAIRLSDGKYSSMHFAAGSAYFDLKDWSRCARAFAKAAEMNEREESAPYNAALCLAHEGYYRDAAQMMQQVLTRNPNRSDRADIQRMIAAWRR